MKSFAAVICGTVLILSACKKENTSKLQLSTTSGEVSGMKAGTEKFSALVDRMNAESSAESDKEITDEYTALDKAELEQFFEAKFAKDSLYTAEQIKSGNGSDHLTSGQEAEVASSMKASRANQDQFNKLSDEKFGKPVNKLTVDELIQLAEAFEAAAGDDKISNGSCPAESYFASVTSLERNGRDYYGIWRVRQYGTRDCDFEYRFDGNFNNFYGRTWFSRRLFDFFRNRLSCRRYGYNDGVDTFIVVGATRLWMIMGKDIYAQTRVKITMSR